MKQVIIIREDLDMSKGKCVAQGSHVSVISTLKADDEDVDEWLDNGCVKITLGVENEEQLRDIITDVRENSDLPVSIIKDQGRTEIPEGTTTAGAIGPADEEEIDKFTEHLPLFN